MSSNEAVSLHVMAIVGEQSTMELMNSVFTGAGDDLVLATDLAEGLARAAAEVPEVVFIDVSLGNGAGLALVHHLRAVSPEVSVFALAHESSTELGSQVTALGGEGVLMHPLTGDELLMAVSAVRRRRAEQRELIRLERQAAEVRQGAELAVQIADAADAKDRSSAGQAVVNVFTQATRATTAMVYVPAGEGSTQLMRVAERGDVGQAPSFCAEMELHNHARANGLEVIPLALKSKMSGLVVLEGTESTGEQLAPLLRMLAAQSAMMLSLVHEREHSDSGAMKDPRSSAYTFAYFVDVAGREIDKSRRHKRRFALATLVLEGERDSDIEQAATDVADKVLKIVRDTDVLARVDQGEFYLLLPETGGAGGHALRRRVTRQTGSAEDRRAAPPGPELTMGVATFPHDGSDLSRLLRVAKHRADASRASVVRRLALDRQSLEEVVDMLLWHDADPGGDEPLLEAPRSIELPVMDFMTVAVAAVGEAIRGGETHIIVTERPGMSVGTAVRASLGREPEGFRAVDVSRVPGCADIDALCLIAEHGAYVIVGRLDRDVVRAVHACDPLLADLMIQRLGEAAGKRLID